MVLTFSHLILLKLPNRSHAIFSLTHTQQRIIPPPPTILSSDIHRSSPLLSSRLLASPRIASHRIVSQQRPHPPSPTHQSTPHPSAVSRSSNPRLSPPPSFPVHIHYRDHRQHYPLSSRDHPPIYTAPPRSYRVVFLVPSQIGLCCVALMDGGPSSLLCTAFA